MLRLRSPIARWGATASVIGCLITAPALSFTERLAAIPIPAALRPHLSAACEAWGRHVEQLIEQHRQAGELRREEIDREITKFYVAKSYCSLGKVLEALAMFETISLARPKTRPLW
jgi:hypothetical protein